MFTRKNAAWMRARRPTATRSVARAAQVASAQSLEALEPRQLLSLGFSGGIANDVATDAAGNVSLVYFDSAAKRLKYATESASHVWSAATIVDNSGSDVMSQVAMAISPAGNVGIAYYDATRGDLRYATYYRRAWHVATIDSVGVTGQNPSIAWAADGTPVISYFNATLGALRVAKANTTGTWAISTLLGRRSGVYSSIALDPATHLPAIAYQNSYGSVYLAEKTATGFTVATLLATPSGRGALSLIFDASNYPAVSYSDAGTGAVNLIRKRRGRFVIVPIANVGFGHDPHATVLLDRATGIPKVAFYDASRSGIFLANYNAITAQYNNTLLKVGGDVHTQATLLNASGSVTFSSVDLSANTPVLSVLNTAITALPPTDVAVPATAATSINLHWTDNSTNETGFLVERSTDGKVFSTLALTAANATGYLDSGLAAGSLYYYRVSAVGPSSSYSLGMVSQQSQAPGSPSILVGNTTFTGAPQYLLSPTALASMQAKAAANSPQWVAFKASLDAQLNHMTGTYYQGSQLPAAADFALGYQLLKNSDPQRAAAYADKAIAIMLSGVRSDIKGSWGSKMFLARGDGVTRQFILPNSNINAATFVASMSTVQVQAVVKGAANGVDEVDYYAKFFKASLTPDGAADFTEGLDWRYNADNAANTIDWSLAGAEPVTGSTYYVTEASEINAASVAGSYTLVGNVLTFATAPAANKGIFVEYQYGTPTAGASTLGYQETSDNHGGFNNVFIDTNYPTRYLKNIAISLDWIWSYKGLSGPVRSEVMGMLARWSDYLRDHGYFADSPASNYGAGHYAFRMATAIALSGRSPDGPRLQAEMQAYHTNKVLPLFQPSSGSTGTLKGGYWNEGWNYGALAIQNVLTSSLAFENVGWGSAAAEKSWADELVQSILIQQPTQSTIYDGGDSYAWPMPLPNKTMMSDVAFAATDPTLKSYANWVVQNYAGALETTWEDLLYRDPSAAASNWGSNLPLQSLAQGTGLVVARKDWNYDSTWLAFKSGNLLSADHQDPQGWLEINRGADTLLVNAGDIGGPDYYQNKSRNSNAVVIDDGGAGEQNYSHSQGYWYGDGVTMPHYDGTDDYTYMQGDYGNAYGNANGVTNPAAELVRDVFYVRGADYVIVYDRATTTQAQYTKQLQWNFSGTPIVSGDSWSVTAGSSKLMGHTFSDVPLTTTTQSVALESATVNKVITTNTSPTASVQYVTALQTGPSTTVAEDPSVHVESGDGKLDGVQMGAYVVLFGRHGLVAGDSSYSVSSALGSTLTHYVTDLQAGASYTLTGADQASAVANSEGVLTFTTTGTGAAQTVSLAL